MDTVTGIGVVHDYFRWAADDQKLRLLFQKTPKDPLHGWEITRRGWQETRIAGTKYKVTHNYLIVGHYAISDSVASEKLFNLVLDAVNQKFIDIILTNTEGHTLPQATIKEWMFAGVLCHRAELVTSVTEIVVKTPEADQQLLKIALGQYLEPGSDPTIQTDVTIQ
jgi:hypothetical protein